MFRVTRRYAFSASHRLHSTQLGADENRRIVLAARPTGMVDDGTVRIERVFVPTPGDGEALVRVRYLSIDPTIRTWMNDVPGYLPPIGIGEVVRSAGIGEVVASNSERYRPGDLVFGMTGWQDYTIAGEGAAAMRPLPAGLRSSIRRAGAACSGPGYSSRMPT